MAKDVLITPASGIIEFKDSSVSIANIYEDNGDLYIGVTSGNLILGDGTPTNLEIGSSTVAVDFNFLGGGTLTSSGNALNIGSSGDTINFSVSGVTYTWPSSIATNAISASKWETARINTVTLTGDVTGSGSVSVDGSANWTVSFATTVVDDSHSHAFNNLTSKTSGTGTYTTSGDFRAPIFYDSNNTTYYVDPASTSNLNGLSTLRFKQSQQSITGNTATTTLDFSAYHNFYVTLSTNTTFAFSNLSDNIGSSGYIFIKQDVTGGRSFTLPAQAKTPGGRTIVQSTGSNALSLITFYVVDVNTVVVNYIGNFS